MRGKLALAGLNPAATEVGTLIDASWAALCDLAGPGEHIAETWASLTGDVTAAQGGPDAPVDRAASHAVENLSEEDMAKFVPAWNKDSYDDDEFRRFWSHTAQFAGGQEALLKMTGGPAGETAAAPEAPVAPSPFGSPGGE